MGTNALLLHLGKGRREGKGKNQDATASLRPGQLERLSEDMRLSHQTS